MNQKVKMMDEKKFDYAKFENDLKEAFKSKQKTAKWVSENICLRGPTYLSNAIKGKRLAANILVAVAGWAELDLKNYEIKKPVVKKEPVKKAEPAKKTEPSENAGPETVKGDQSVWNCMIRVDEEFGMAMMKIFKNGEELALGRSYTYGHDDAGIVQGISYAAHMCYKIVQQKKMATESMKSVVEENEATELEEVPVIDDDGEVAGGGVGRVIFKDWIKKYEKDNSKAGKLARYVSSYYQYIPATGKKRIRMYLRLNKGETHLQTFDTMWAMYLSWYNSHFDNGSVMVGAAV